MQCAHRALWLRSALGLVMDVWSGRMHCYATSMPSTRRISSHAPGGIVLVCCTVGWSGRTRRRLHCGRAVRLLRPPSKRRQSGADSCESCTHCTFQSHSCSGGFVRICVVLILLAYWPSHSLPTNQGYAVEHTYLRFYEHAHRLFIS